MMFRQMRLNSLRRQIAALNETIEGFVPEEVSPGPHREAVESVRKELQDVRNSLMYRYNRLGGNS